VVLRPVALQRAVFAKWLLVCILRHLQVLLQGAAQDSEKYKDHVQSSTIEDIQIVDAPYHSTLCNVCQTVCHDHCNLDEISDAGQLFLACQSS